MIRRIAVPLVVLLLAGCAPKPAEHPAQDSAAALKPGAPPAPTMVAEVGGFSTPESVLWDAEQGVWFVSNINGNPTARDGNGFISRLTKDGAIDSLRFIMSGKGGVKLNGPKGMALAGDTLWVADIDAVRGFDRRSGRPVASVELGKQAKFLNDVVAGPDGTVYVTDTGILFDAKGNATHPDPDRIFALAGRKATVAAEGDWLERPNGITWDAANHRFILAPFGGPHLLGWRPGVAKVDTIATGPGSQDGVEMWQGAALVTSWADSTVFALDNGAMRKVVTGRNSPADIGLDPTRGWLAIPLFMDNRVEFWALK